MLPKKSEAIFDCVNAEGDGDDIASAITSFADDCQDSLGLDSWPAENTCIEFENDFNLFPYMDEVCSPKCNFGGRLSSKSRCICDSGYWNTTCEAICPGGASVPCSGYGTCNQSTGNCNCPVNRKTANNCSVCSFGWYGSNCNLAINYKTTLVKERIAIVGQLGSVYSFDGVSYAVKIQGEMLLLAVSNNVILQGKFVTCYQNYSCVPFIAVRLGDDAHGHTSVTVQSGRVYDSKPIVYINGNFQSLDEEVYFNGFMLYRSSFFEVTVDVKSIAVIRIRNVGQYLHLKVEIPSTLINQTSGLLSGTALETIDEKLDHLYSALVPEFGICTSLPTLQTVLPSESSVSLVIDSYKQTYGNDTTFNITRFIVQACDSIISFPSNEYKYQTQGGFGLNFNKSSINHEFAINTSETSELTFEILVKKNNVSSSGVLFSFTSDTSLIVMNGELSLEVHTYAGNETVFDTNITLDENSWNKVILTYDNSDGSTAVYVIDKDAAVSTTGYFKLNQGIFNSKGILTIGHWLIPSNGKEYQLPNGFEGSIENFLVWNVLVLQSEVSQLWQMNPAIPSESLILSFQFNEGDGFLTRDNVGYFEVNFPEFPWKAPEWFVSDLNYTSKRVPDFTYTNFSNKSLENEAVLICSTKIFDTSCPGMSNSTKEFFYLICKQVISAENLKTAGYSVIMDFIDICEKELRVVNTKKASFCFDLIGTNVNISACSSICKFGYEYSNGTCACFNGYHGALCNKTCPGGSDFPCNNHGQCMDDGTCKCLWNWNGNSNCSACTFDSSGSVIGPDCTILKTSSLSSLTSKIAAVSSNGYYMTFEGRQISFIEETGAFLLFESSILGVEVHVYQVSCKYGSCIAAISVSSASQTAVIAPPRQGYEPSFYLNGELRTLENITNIFNTITVTHDSFSEISIKVTSIGSLTVTVIAQKEFLQASVITDSTVCQTGTGVFGACDGVGKDYSMMTQNDIRSYIVTNFKLFRSVILDSLRIPMNNRTYNSGYALMFNRTAVMSAPISYPTGFTLDNADFSMSLFFKPFKYGGYIISYAKDVTFAIKNTMPMVIVFSDRSVQLSFSAELNVWNQIVLTFRRSTHEIDVYSFGKDSNVLHETVTLDCPGIFENEGVVVLGEYLPAVGGDKYTFSSDNFVGVIDELTVWKDPIPDFLIYQAYHLNTKASSFISKLSLLFSFTEGVGTVAFEQVSGNDLELPSFPWQSPIWIISDLELKELHQAKDEEMVIEINTEIERICSLFFDENFLSLQCSGVSAFIKWWYKQSCIITATNTGNISDTTISMIDFISICIVTGGDASHLYNEICAIDIFFPEWLSQKCSNCKFGFKRSNKCVCYYGYHGINCDKVCPGGVKTPCNLHGDCDVNGTCQCTEHWTGAECSQCETGWSGTDCIIFKQPLYDPLRNNVDNLVAQVNLIGQLTTFDGVILDVPVTGYFNLISISSLDLEIHGRFSLCTAGKSLQLCLVGIIILHSGEKYYVSSTAYQETTVEIITPSSTLLLYDTLIIGHITFRLESTATLTMSLKTTDVVVRMSAINGRFLTTVSMSRNDWNKLQFDIEGTLTACNTTMTIVASNCNISRYSICLDPTRNIPDSCKMNLSTVAADLFFTKSEYKDITFIAIIEEIYLQALKSNCFMYSGTGVSATGIMLPESDFTIELHVRPTNFGGIILTYVYHEYIVLIHHADGLIVLLEGVYHTTGLILDQNVWNQISLSWRADASILEVYLTNNEGKQFYSVL